MKRTGKFEQLLRLSRITGMLLLACTWSSSAYGSLVFIDIPPSPVQVGQPFSVNVNANGLDPTNELYDYSFDLQFDPSVFQVSAANDGTIFDYGGNTGLYFDGTIDNVNGFVTFQSGIDIFQGFSGTGGLLGAFTFDALQPASNSSISVQNVALETFAAALNLGPPDIDPGTLPVATVDVAGPTTTPEPGSGVLAALAIVAGIFILRRQREVIEG
jgi:hypothetical protein